MTAKNVYWCCIRFLVLSGLALLTVKLCAAPPPIPIVHLLATDPCGAEAGPDIAQFTVYRDGPTNTSLTITYHIGGTAHNGVDYQTLSGAVTIPPCASSAPITVTPIDDNFVEGSEYIGIALEQPLVWPPPYIVCWPSFGFAHIEDDDFPPTNRPPFVRIVSPPDGSVFVAPVDITIVAHAWDFDGRVRTVEFFDGTNSLGVVTNHPPRPRPGPISVLDVQEGILHLEEDPDVFPELDVDANVDVIPFSPFRIVWENAPPGPHILTAVATDNQGASTRSGPIEIRVTDPPLQPIVNVRATDPEAAEPDPTGDRLDTATFTVHRTGPTDIPLTVFYRLSGTASNGIDYRELPHSVTIPIGSRSAEVVVEPIDDDLVEGTEKVVLTLAPPGCITIHPRPPDCYRVGRHDVARAAIHDNDTPPNRPPFVQIVRPLDGSVFLAPADISIVARARDFDGEVVLVEFFEGTNSLGVVSNNAAALTPMRAPFHLGWSNVPPGHYILTAEATDNDGATSRSRPVEIKVTERTLPPVVSIEATDPEASEGEGLAPVVGSSPSILDTATFTVRRTGSTDHSLLVYYRLSGTAMNGEDYRELLGRVAIPQHAASAQIMILPIDDNEVEGPESVVATLESPIDIAIHPPPSNGYVVGSNGVARAVIRDNDVSPTNRPPRVAIVRPDDGEVFIAPAGISIYAAARDADGFVRTVEFFANDTSLGVVSNSLSSIEPTEQIFGFHWPDVPAGAYTLTAKATDNRGAMTVSVPVRIKVIEPNLPPIVTIHATDPWASEGDLHPSPVLIDAGNGIQHFEFIGPPIAELPNIATFTVRRSGGTNVPLVVYYTLGGTASNGVDYRALSGQVTIPRGNWSAHILVDPIDDLLLEGTETVIAGLRPIPCPRVLPPPPECYVVGDPDRAIAYIRDNDLNQRPDVEIVHPLDGQAFPANSNIEINVAARDPDGWVELVEFFDGTNKIGEDLILFIHPPPPGLWQHFSLTWSNVPPGSYILTAKATDNLGAMSVSRPIEIKVLEPCRLPAVTIVAIDPEASERSPLLGIPPDTATFRVSRTCADDTDLLVLYRIGGTASNAFDYEFLRGHVMIPAGSASADIVVDPIDDHLVEGTESVVIELEQLACPAIDPPPLGCYLVGTPGRAIAHIRDNDTHPPRVAILKPHDGEIFRAPADIEVTALALDPDGWVTRVEFFEGTNRIGVAEVHFIVPPPPGQLQTFSIRWEDVPAGRYVLTAKATDDLGAMTRSGPIEISVVNHDPIPVVNIVAIDPFAREGTDNIATFRIRRTGETNAPLTVHYAIRGTASNGVDYLTIPETVTIPAGRRSARIVITPIDDRLVEHIETVALRLIPAALYNVGRPGRAAAIIVDNDHPRPPTCRLSDGLFHLCRPDADGFSYRLEASTDLLKWEPICYNVVTDGALHFVDPDAAEMPARFYRVIPEVPLPEED